MTTTTHNSEFIIIGATGKVGRELLHFFSQAHIGTCAVTRDISKAKALPFVNWVQADLSDRDRMTDVSAGAKAVFLATSFSDDFTEKELNAIEASRVAGVQHLVKLSTKSASIDHEFLIPRLHAQVEDHLKKSGLQWTILQPAGFMQNWLGNLSLDVKTKRKIFDASGDGKLPYIDTRDIAEVAFRVLTEGDIHGNKTYQLTGREAVNYYEIADTITGVIGETVNYIAETADQTRDRLTKKGVPDWGIRLFMIMADNQRAGKSAAMTTTVQDVLHKPARSVYDFVKDYEEWFK